MKVQKRPFLSVCIPAYNRVTVLGDLLTSVLVQDYQDYEVLICEDKSKQREQIRATVESFASKFGNRLRYFENPTNLGYDGNLKELVRKAEGRFCVFMGNDDILTPKALSIISNSLTKHGNAGVFLRTYAAFDESPDKIDQVFRYFPEDLYLEPGKAAISLFFRRSVVISGMTVDRDLSLKLETNEFDGSLLYQLYLVGSLLAMRGGVYSPEIVTLYRNGGIPEFGNAAAERGKFVPTERTPESSVHFMRSMLQIASRVQQNSGLSVYQGIFRDMANYSFPFIAIQADKGRFVLAKYIGSLARLGFYKSLMFWMYSIALLTVGPGYCSRLIRLIKTKLGRTPKIGYSLSKVRS